VALGGSPTSPGFGSGTGSGSGSGSGSGWSPPPLSPPPLVSPPSSGVAKTKSKLRIGVIVPPNIATKIIKNAMSFLNINDSFEYLV
jgi:hypothetical protein